MMAFFVFGQIFSKREARKEKELFLVLLPVLIIQYCTLYHTRDHFDVPLGGSSVYSRVSGFRWKVYLMPRYKPCDTISVFATSAESDSDSADVAKRLAIICHFWLVLARSGLPHADLVPATHKTATEQ